MFSRPAARAGDQTATRTLRGPPEGEAMLRDVWTILRREYKQRVKSKAFVFATLGIPVLVIGMIAVSAFVSAAAVGGDDDPDLIAVVDSTGALTGHLVPRLALIGYSAVAVPLDQPLAVEEAIAATDTGSYSGVLILGAGASETGSADFYTPDPPSRLRRAGIENAVVLASVEERGAGESEFGTLTITVPAADSDSLLSVEMREVREDVGAALGFAGGFFLYMTILLYAATVLRATLEEKQSRIVEVLVSSVRPAHLMMGKILGVGSAGLTQLGIWLASVLIAATIATGIVESLLPAEGLEVLDTVRQVLPGPWTLALFIVFFLFGYFIYAGLFAAVGAMCSSEQEAQYAQMPVVLLMVAQIMILMPILQAPDSSLAVGASLFPMFSPVLMWARVAAGAAAGWEIALSCLLMLLALVFCAWLAGRIYRIGILSTGKRPSVKELAGWVIRG